MYKESVRWFPILWGWNCQLSGFGVWWVGLGGMGLGIGAQECFGTDQRIYLGHFRTRFLSENPDFGDKRRPNLFDFRWKGPNTEKCLQERRNASSECWNASSMTQNGSNQTNFTSRGLPSSFRWCFRFGYIFLTTLSNRRLARINERQGRELGRSSPVSVAERSNEVVTMMPTVQNVMIV